MVKTYVVCTANGGISPRLVEESEVTELRKRMGSCEQLVELTDADFQAKVRAADVERNRTIASLSSVAAPELVAPDKDPTEAGYQSDRI